MWHFLTTVVAIAAMTTVLLIAPTPLRAPLHRLRARLTEATRRRLVAMATTPERGDVPGWVMVTLMTAGLVAIVWVLADDWLRQLFQQAVDRVSGP